MVVLLAELWVDHAADVKAVVLAAWMAARKAASTAVQWVDLSVAV